VSRGGGRGGGPGQGRRGRRTATSQIVAVSALSLVARAKPSIWPRRAQRLPREQRIHIVQCVCASATCSFPGSRLGKPTCARAPTASASRGPSRVAAPSLRAPSCRAPALGLRRAELHRQAALTAASTHSTNQPPMEAASIHFSFGSTTANESCTVIHTHMCEHRPCSACSSSVLAHLMKEVVELAQADAVVAHHKFQALCSESRNGLGDGGGRQRLSRQQRPAAAASAADALRRQR